MVRGIELGIQRDFSSRLSQWKQVRKEFIYYGNLSNPFLLSKGREPKANDLEDRIATLNNLKEYSTNQFTKARYRNLPGYNPWKEALASTLGALLGAFHLSDELVEAVAPDMKEYWNKDSFFGNRLRATLTAPLKRAMKRGDDILVISHSLGTLIAYDTLWKFSRMWEYVDFHQSKISLLLTLGSPIADETVKRNLRGAQANHQHRYPSNIKRWVNIAAEDDFIAHDERVANDYQRMKRMGLVEEIKDHGIYNLSVRHEGSNPHSSAGYLIHPKTVETVVGWL